MTDKPKIQFREPVNTHIKTLKDSDIRLAMRVIEEATGRKPTLVKVGRKIRIIE